MESPGGGGSSEVGEFEVSSTDTLLFLIYVQNSRSHYIFSFYFSKKVLLQF